MKTTNLMVVLCSIFIAGAAQANIAMANPDWYSRLTLVGNHLPNEQAYTYVCSIAKSAPTLKLVSKKVKTGDNTYQTESTKEIAVTAADHANLKKWVNDLYINHEIPRVATPYECGQEDKTLMFATDSGDSGFFYGTILKSTACGQTVDYPAENTKEIRAIMYRNCAAAIAQP